MSQAQQSAKVTGTETVTVCCKLPGGLRMRLFKNNKLTEPILGGGAREFTMAQETGDEFVVAGWSHPQNRASAVELSGGYAMTTGVPKVFWDEWLRQNEKSNIVVNGLIFAADKEADARKEAKANLKVRSGLERLDPTKLPKGLEKSELMKKEPDLES